MLHFLVTAHSFMPAYAVVKRTQKALSYGISERVNLHAEPTREAFVIQLT